MGEFGFSYIGLIYLLMLQIPNIIWAKNKPEGYTSANENKVLLVFERTGQVLTVATVLCFSNTNPHGWDTWLLWLAASAVLMLAYELYWVRYFCNGHTLKDFYRPFLGVPLPGATLPVAAFILLGIYGKLLWLILAAGILGIGHIGIHLQHLRELE
ncbi:MAG: hypothetical protein LBM65_01925 [Oscillospiraceae bacterium]|jgi:hypothetical protein|nr:hypothetical protein [Oscillospiraceae bacterium]